MRFIINIIILVITFCFTNSYAESFDIAYFEEECSYLQHEDYSYVRPHYRKGCITKKGHIRSGTHVRIHVRK